MTMPYLTEYSIYKWNINGIFQPKAWLVPMSTDGLSSQDNQEKGFTSLRLAPPL